MNDNGIVYLLKNKWLQGVYKIGLTRTSVEDRIKSLSNTSLPGDFECVAFFKTDYALQLEKYLHRKFRQVRCNSRREFFTFHSDEIAKSCVSNAAKDFQPRSYTEIEKAKIKSENTEETPSKKAKQMGCKSLSQVSQLTGVSLQTLSNWHKDKPELFRVVCTGVVVLTQGEQP
jgi:hypothetical protein